MLQNNFNGTRWYGGIVNSLQPNGLIDGIGANSKQVPYGTMITVTYSAKADANGNVTFFIGRAGDNRSLPLGIDNIVVTGSIKPMITYSGNPCPKMVVTVGLKQDYPAWTTYSWSESVTGTTGTSKNFKFEPQDKNTNYTVTATVTLPGCTPIKSDPYVIKTGDCCSDADGNPMAITNILYDDFGNFASSFNYEYTDEKGLTLSVVIPNSQLMYSDDT